MAKPKKKLVPVDSDVASKALPESPPEGITLLDGTFLAYDQTMEVFRSMQTILSRLVNEPELIGCEEVESLDNLPNVDWLACYVWAITLPGRKGTDLENASPLELSRMLPRSAFRELTNEFTLFMKEMAPDPNLLADVTG